MKRPAINITGRERIARVAVGIGGAVLGSLLLGSQGGATARVLELLLILAGLDLLVTGALGHCPLYKRLGYVPASFRKAP